MMTSRIAGNPCWTPVLLFLTGLLSVGCRPVEKPNTNETTTASLPAPVPYTDVEAPPIQTVPTPDEPIQTPEEPIQTTPEPTPPVATESVSIELGSPELTAGIPGTGALTSQQIRDWLDNPENHRVIEPTLPAGLAAAQANIQGLDTNPLTKAKIELGRQLYFDTRLSSDGTISCASCHNPDEGYGAHTQFGVGVDGQTGNRNSPSATTASSAVPNSGTVVPGRWKLKPWARSPIPSKWATRTRRPSPRSRRFPATKCSSKRSFPMKASRSTTSARPSPHSNAPSSPIPLPTITMRSCDDGTTVGQRARGY